MGQRLAGLLAAVVNAAATTYAIASATLALFPTIDPFAQWTVGVVAGAIWFYWLYHSLPSVSQRRFRENSSRFSDYFATWYGQEGRVYIYCTDIAWLESASLSKAVAALKHKRDQARIYVRDDSSPLVAELRQNGVFVGLVPNSAHSSRIRMSLRVNDGEMQLIVRDKTQRPLFGQRNTIIFRETSDGHQCNLAYDLFRRCE